MAKKKFTLPEKKLNLSLNKDIHEVYKEALEIESVSEQSKKTLKETLLTAQNDPSLSVESKKSVMSALVAKYEYLFSEDTLSDDYFALKEEVKFLSVLTAVSYVVMAKRLKKIRDEKLYLKDGYVKFEQFIDEELSLARNTVYKYMDIVNIFEKDLLENKIKEPSKLIEALPLVKKYPEYKQEIVTLAQTKSAREVKARINEIKSLLDQEKKNNAPISQKEFLKRMERNPYYVPDFKREWEIHSRGEDLPQSDRLVSFNEVMSIMKEFKREYPYWIDIADLLIKNLRRLK